MASCSTTCVEVTTQTKSILFTSSKHAEPTRPNPDFSPPTYTATQINASIPKHCFHPSTSLSLYYIFRDIFQVILLSSFACYIPLLPTPSLRFLAWSIYAFTQGLFLTGLWELAHEMGHSALFASRTPNHVFGLFIHSFLLVPFHSWRITHSTHHKNTNNLDKDIAFVPPTHEAFIAAKESQEPNAVWDYVEDMPVVALTHLFFHQLIAFPLYLTINNLALERMANARWWQRSHYYLGGDGPNFKPGHWRDILISDIGIAVMAGVLFFATRVFGGWSVMLFYGFPYLWTNHWILTITFLQHTSTQIPYYPTSTWTFLRGAASTVDRDFGLIGRHIFHGAIENHVLHHHVSRIPFYYAPEATRAVRAVMGSHYQSDEGGCWAYMWAWWTGFRGCRFVVETREGSGVYFFGRGQ